MASDKGLQSKIFEISKYIEELQKQSMDDPDKVTEALAAALGELEIRVKERTAELEKANSALEEEIAEHKEAEEAVKAERQRFNDVLETLPAYLVLLTPDYHVPFANRFFRERFGESHGRPCFEYLFGRSEPCEICETYTVLKTKEPHRWEWTGPDGRNYDIFDFPFTDTDGSALIMEMGIDITERKRAEETLRVRALQQEVAARLGLQALAGLDLAILMNEAVSELAKTLGVEYTKVLKLLPDCRKLLLVAGVGWKEGLVGRGTVGSGRDSQAGYTLLSSEPVIVEDLRTETRFSGPPLLHEHGVISGMSVIISGHGRPFGVLGVHTVKHRNFTADDVHFLQAIANLIAMVVEQKRVEAELEKYREHLEELVQERTGELEAANEELQAEITERTQAEDALAKERANLQTIFDVVNIGMLLIDGNGAVKRINNTVPHLVGKKDLSTLCGHQPGDLLGCIHAVNDPSGCGHTPHCTTCPIRNAFETVLCSGRSVHGVETEATLLINGDETHLWLEASVDPLILDGTQHAILAISNITKRKRAEDEIEKLNQDLQHRTAALEAANKELESFSYSVSHDLRAPLRAMDGFSRILLEEYSSELSPEGQRYLQLVRSSAQQMGRLIDDLLAFSRLGRHTLNKRCVMPIDIVDNVLEEMKGERTGRQVDIVVGDLPACEADPTLLKQVFVNLISNALKFTRKRETARIEVGCQQRNGKVVYFIKDNGAGFDMKYVHKLFGVFQRLHSADEYEGTGVGLANVLRIIHRHGGSIWAEGEVDKGATFYFTIDGDVLK